jgi:NaMN:DMB phosphoribosyltransferase
MSPLPKNQESATALLRETVDSVSALDPRWTERAQVRLDSLTKPLGSLGRLEEIARRLVAIREEERPDCSGKAIFTLAADHGNRIEAKKDGDTGSEGGK